MRPGSYGGCVVLGLVGLTLVFGRVGHAQTKPTQAAVSRELAAMYEADQEIRRKFSSLTEEERKAFPVEDLARRDRVLEIVRQELLVAAEDYFHAAIILQHSAPGSEGYTPQHYLLAHVLATVAGFQGHQRGRWLSAAALDRFLEFSERKQFFGTQWNKGENGQWVPGNYNQFLTIGLEKQYALPARVQSDRLNREESRLPSSRAQAEVSRELAEMYRTDQAERQSDWSKLSPDELKAIVDRDRQRLERVHEILSQENLGVADDYYHAAMILQHGATPQDYLLAHVLATAAAFQGHNPGKWLAAAALDRFLGSIDQEQIFGTQFYQESGGPLRLKPPLAKLLTESVREHFGVPPVGVTLKKLEELRHN